MIYICIKIYNCMYRTCLSNSICLLKKDSKLNDLDADLRRALQPHSLRCSDWTTSRLHRLDNCTRPLAIKNKVMRKTRNHQPHYNTHACGLAAPDRATLPHLHEHSLPAKDETPKLHRNKTLAPTTPASLQLLWRTDPATQPGTIHSKQNQDTRGCTKPAEQQPTRCRAPLERQAPQERQVTPAKHDKKQV